MKRTLFAALACALLGTTTSVQARTDTSIYDGLLNAGHPGELSTFVELMHGVFDDEDLKRMFGGDAVLTLFAPTNAAFEALFAALSEEELSDLQDPDRIRLERLLRYHMTEGVWRKATGALRMLDGSVAHTRDDGRSFRIDRATISEQTRWSNGTVATIDTVISPEDAPLPVGCGITSSHTNTLKFGTFSSVSGTFGTYSVTHCQPYTSPPSFDGSELVIKAGRKDSDGPAGFFMNGLTQANVLPTGTKLDMWPSELNFAQVVTELTASVGGETFACANVRFGQGSSGDANNWWVGQEGAVYGSDDESYYLDLDCTAASTSSCLRFRSTGIADEFYVYDVDCSASEAAPQ